jgi:hypothetical protein
VAAGDLVPGDELRTAPGPTRIASIERLHGRFRVYNLEVEQDHVFFASKARALTHNGNECAEGLIAGAKAPPARITPGSLPASEEASILETIRHIDAGTTPTGSIATKWKTKFKNWAGDLPGGKGQDSPYLEFRVAPPPGTLGARHCA